MNNIKSTNSNGEKVSYKRVSDVDINQVADVLFILILSLSNILKDTKSGGEDLVTSLITLLGVEGTVVKEDEK